MVEDYIANDILEKGLPLGGVTVLYSSANQVSYPDKPKGKILFFDNLFRYIRSRFDETFGKKAVSNL